MPVPMNYERLCEYSFNRDIDLLQRSQFAHFKYCDNHKLHVGDVVVVNISLDEDKSGLRGIVIDIWSSGTCKVQIIGLADAQTIGASRLTKVG